MKAIDTIQSIGDMSDFSDYTLKDYYRDIENLGVETVWNAICDFVLKNGNTPYGLLNIRNFGELYEIGLAIQDKNNKKLNGQYYTPDDVARVMAQWFERVNGDNICDVACGTGKLILTYLELIGKDSATELIRNGKLYLYDIDDVALKICKTIILATFGKRYEDKIHTVCGNFLNSEILLPENSKVICNPPYARLKYLSYPCIETDVLNETKELYSAFMEKIIRQSKGSVIITPYSFIGGSKFYSLRRFMNDYNGFIVSFDNVPGNIFCGRKYGIFNTNTSNSVRASVTVVENKPETRGFRLSPLIRFKNDERNILLQCNTLEDFIYDRYQTVDEKENTYYKCDKRLGKIFEAWRASSNQKVSDFVTRNGRFLISMSNTCRYYTAASEKTLNRKGQIQLRVENESAFYFLYCLINSSFAYWHWRLYDGGITFTKALLLNMPVFYDMLTKGDLDFFKDTAKEMMSAASGYIVSKNNVGVQENIKFPRKYRDQINRKLLDILQIDEDEKIFDIIHSNQAFGI